MKYLKEKIILSLFVILTLGLFAQNENSISVIKAETHPSINGQQLFYALPKNIVRIELTVNKTVQVAGPLVKYAKKYLNVSSGSVNKDNDFYEISTISFNRYSVPDSNHFYLINFKESTDIPNIQLNNDGVILGINTFDIANGYCTKSQQNIKYEKIAEDIFFQDFGVKPFVKENTKTFYRTVSTDSTPSKVPYQKSNLESLSDDEIAKNTAALIRKIKKRKLKLLFNQFEEVNPNEAEALEISVRELNKLESYYTSLFLGKSTTSIEKYYFDFNPDENNTEEQKIIAWISPTLGLVSKRSDMNGDSYNPVTLKLKPTTTLPKPNIEVMDSKQKNRVPINYGPFYRIPGRANISLIYNNRVINQQQMQIAQKGIVVPMPAKYLNGNYEIHFFAETGALKSITKQKQNDKN